MGTFEAGLNLPIDGAKFDFASKALLDRFEASYGWMFKTTVTPNAGAPFEADIDYTVWSEVFTCPHCGGEVVFYDSAFNEDDGTIRDTFPCVACGVSLGKSSLDRRMERITALNGNVFDRIMFRPVRIFWRNGKTRGEKAVEISDLNLLERIARTPVAWFPSGVLQYMHSTHERADLQGRGFSTVEAFWPDRSLISLSILWSWAGEEEDHLLKIALRFWIEQAILGLSWLNVYEAKAFSQLNRYKKGFYYVPSLVSECSVRYNLLGSMPSRGKRQVLANLWASTQRKAGEVFISTGSSTHFPIPDNSVDYVFVDPPFGQNIYYSDMAHLMELWHAVSTSFADEAIIDRNSQRPKTEDTYGALIRQCFAEFFRVLKPGRWMTVEFSNSSNTVWLLIQHALSEAGFVVADTRVIDKGQLSFTQRTAINTVKHDLVISAYKPAVATEQLFEIAAGSADGAWAFVREHLSRIPATEGSKGQALVVRERQADRVYERMVGYHVARNTLVPMTAAEFYAGLEQRFPVRDGMYFLPGQVEEYERFRITFKDLAVQELFIRDESTAVQWLRQTLKDRPRTFADVQPLFMREMQSSVASWEEMPDLREMLEGNFVTDGSGRWSVPDPKKAEDLDQLRTRALLREFEGYKDGRGPLTRFRTEAIRAGFKAAWAAKDYATVTTVGRRLPSDVFIEDSALLHYFRNAERLAP